MSTIWIHPDAPKCDHHRIHLAQQRVAWVDVMIITPGVGWGTDRRVSAVQTFIDAQGWKGLAINNYRGRVTGNVVQQSNYSTRRLKSGANGLLENSGASVFILWDWVQVLEWLSAGWPSTRMATEMSSPVGTWCFKDDIDPKDDHLDRNEYSGWPYAMKQMRTIGIPPEVRKLRRPITEHEIIVGLCGALKNHRVSLNQIHK